MCLECLCKGMTARSVGNEIQVIRFGGVQYRRQGCGARVCNWARWESFDHIGIVGVFNREVAAV